MAELRTEMWRGFSEAKGDQQRATDSLKSDISSLRSHIDEQVAQLDETKAAKWSEKALSATIAFVCFAVLSAVLALVVIANRPHPASGTVLSSVDGP